MPERFYDFNRVLPLGSKLFNLDGTLVDGIEVEGTSDQLRYRVRLRRGARLSITRGRYWVLIPGKPSVKLVRIALFGNAKTPPYEEEFSFNQKKPIETWSKLAEILGLVPEIREKLMELHRQTQPTPDDR